MTDSTRIKQFLKKGIQAKILSAEQLLQLKTDHLAGVSELKDIDRNTIAKTLQQIQGKMRSSGQKPKKEDIGEDSVMKLIEERAGSYLDEVKKIYSL